MLALVKFSGPGPYREKYSSVLNDYEHKVHILTLHSSDAGRPERGRALIIKGKVGLNK